MAKRNKAEGGHALNELLKSIGACSGAVEWAKGKTIATAWRECERADWMLWLCARMAGKRGWPSRKQVVLVACACAQRALGYFEKRYPNDKRPRQAIEAAREWAHGKATAEQARDASAFYYDSYFADAAASYSAAAAAAAAAAIYSAASCSADSYADADAAAACAAYVAAATAAASYSVAAAAASGGSKEIKVMADLCRKNLNVPTRIVSATKFRTANARPSLRPNTVKRKSARR